MHGAEVIKNMTETAPDSRKKHSVPIVCNSGFAFVLWQQNEQVVFFNVLRNLEAVEMVPS